MSNVSTSKSSPISVRNLVGTAIFTAIVVVLQLLGSFIHFGPFSISLVLVPIVIGSALYGKWSGAWLGFVFGFVVLVSGDAAVFLAINPFGTVLVCILKGALAGFAAGYCYNLVSKKSKILATVCAAIVAPVVNTGIFLLGCNLFFMEKINEWAAAAGAENVGLYMITAFVGLNFLFELAVNLLLSPVIVRLLQVAYKEK